MKVTQGPGTDTDRSAAYDFLWAWTYLVPFPRQTAISIKNRKFFQPRCI